MNLQSKKKQNTTFLTQKMKYNVSSLEIQKQQSSGKRNIYYIHFIRRNKLKAYYDKLREKNL